MAGVVDVTGWAPREWDSEFFGVSIAQVSGRRATQDALARTVNDARKASVDCLYFLVDADDLATIRAAEANAFALMDVRLTLECAIEGRVNDSGSDDEMIRPARAGDLPRLTAIARLSHRNTRFHVDPHFDSIRSDDLYAVWIERSVKGELADAVWVADVDNLPRGYLTATRGVNAASIGLVAVDAEYRGRGYGERLLRAVQRWSRAEGASRLTVVTQGRSAAAVRFYERAGFSTSAVEFWYHRWLRDV
jgi:GNAT superfamily N-acetyltransferase